MSKSDKNHVIFDFNGVIVNDEELHFESTKVVLKNSLNIEITSDDYYKFFAGKTNKLGFNLTLKNNLGVLRDNTFIVNIENTTLRIPLVKLKVSYQFVGQKGYLKIKEKYGEITYNNHRYFITHKERDKYNLILR